MSDRPHGSVRTGSRDGDAPDAASAPVQPAQGQQPPAAATQTIPATGSQRAAVPAGDGDATGAPTAAAPGGAAAAGAPAAPGAGSAAVGPPAAAGAKKKAGRSLGRGPRRARLQLRHIDTWSALKISLVLSIALFFIWMVAVGVLYGVLNALGVFDTLNELFGQLGTDGESESGSEVLTPGVVFGGAAVIGAINIVLLTALCTVGTFIYNMCSDLVGGLEVTLSERD
jgi:hypothetical protein